MELRSGAPLAWAMAIVADGTEADGVGFGSAATLARWADSSGVL